jgi:hypothetical protein
LLLSATSARLVSPRNPAPLHSTPLCCAAQWRFCSPHLVDGPLIPSAETRSATRLLVSPHQRTADPERETTLSSGLLASPRRRTAYAERGSRSALLSFSAPRRIIPPPRRTADVECKTPVRSAYRRRVCSPLLASPHGTPLRYPAQRLVVSTRLLDEPLMPSMAPRSALLPC